jgi:hypothetical protein
MALADKGTPAVARVNGVARGGLLVKDPLAVEGYRFIYINANTGKAKVWRGGFDLLHSHADKTETTP